MRDGSRFFGTLDLASPLAERTSLCVGIRNSTDQSFPLGFVAGSRVFVCDNLAFRSELMVRRKHTLHGERDFVRKMKLGQLDGAAVTAVGLGLIKGDVRVLELPFLFKNDKELDYVRDKMRPEFEKQFADAGYQLLAWGDVGWVHLYTNQAFQSRAE